MSNSRKKNEKQRTGFKNEQPTGYMKVDKTCNVHKAERTDEMGILTCKEHQTGWV